MNLYKTSDIQIAAVLLAAGHRMLSRSTVPGEGGRRPKLLFHFESTLDLEDTIFDFTNNELRLNPREVLTRLRELKSLVHAI